MELFLDRAFAQNMICAALPFPAYGANQHSEIDEEAQNDKAST
jgi:hypothetical protein